MWDKDIQRPIMNFDLGCAVGDIEWAPYSSTVFAAVTSAGNLYVWDLKQEKHTFMCEHPAMKKAKALHVAFNKTDPIVLVGDERGGVNSFKLSKSLTIGPMEPKEEEQGTGVTSQKLEAKKMEDFLNSLDKIVY
jgi:dynein intermediate chain 1